MFISLTTKYFSLFFGTLMFSVSKPSFETVIACKKSFLDIVPIIKNYLLQNNAKKKSIVEKITHSTLMALDTSLNNRSKILLDSSKYIYVSFMSNGGFLMVRKYEFS